MHIFGQKSLAPQSWLSSYAYAFTYVYSGLFERAPFGDWQTGDAFGLWRLRRSGYVFGEIRTIGLVLFDRRRANLPSERFRRRTILSYWTQILPRNCRKSVFGEKRPLELQNFATKWFQRHTDSAIPTKFRGNRYSGSDQTGARYSSWKRSVFCAFLWGFWSDLAENCIVSLFPHSQPLPSFLQIRPALEEIYPKMSPRLIRISACRTFQHH